MAKAAFLDNIISADGTIEPDRFNHILRITRTELALASGLPRDSVSKSAHLRAQPTQKRLREVAEVINRVRLWTSSVQQAFAWYRSQPIPSFGDQTAEDLVRADRAEHVLSYLARIAVGGYA